jgi:hypothetical protein
MYVRMQLEWRVRPGKQREFIELIQAAGTKKSGSRHRARYQKQYGVQGSDEAQHDGSTWSLRSISNLIKTVEECGLSTAEQVLGLLQLLPESVPPCVAIALHLGAGLLPGNKIQAQELCSYQNRGPLYQV